MEIKELTPKSKEIILQPKDAKGISCDVFSYAVNGKKYLYIVSRIESEDPSLNYTPNLIASFMKRELEAGNGREELFEKALKKTNELVEGLLKENGDLKLDIGVAFIDKDKVSVSKIGKAKLLVSRSGEVFDIFENVTQFSKRHINNKKFSNMVSGEIKNGDKFFFFTPTGQLNFKQKQIVASLAKSSPDDFPNEIHKIASPSVNCSGVYFEINEKLKKVAVAQNQPGETPVVATEVAKISRNDTLKRTTDKFKEMVLGEGSNNTVLSGAAKNRWQLRPKGPGNYFITAVIILVVAAGLFFMTRSNSKFKEAAASINEKLRISESRLLLKQNYEARKFLAEAFAELTALEENSEKEKIQLAALGLLNRLEKVDVSKTPSVLLDLAGSNLDLNGIRIVLTSNGKIFVADSAKTYELGENEAKTVDDLENASLNWLKDNKIIVLGNRIRIVDLEKNKISELRKKFAFEPKEMKNYEDNLYFLGPKNIYKITNALISPREELEWLKPDEAAKITGNFVSFALDSNIYVLTDERKLVIMFKGKVDKTVDLDFEVGLGTELFNLGENELLAVDKELKLARVIDETGELKTSYDLSAIDAVKDAFLDKETRTLFLLSPTRIWELKI